MTLLDDYPDGYAFKHNAYKDEDPDFEGTSWALLSEKQLLESWEMSDVGKAQNFECLKLYVAVQREYSANNDTSSNLGSIALERVEKGFVFGEENGDYLVDP